MATFVFSGDPKAPGRDPAECEMFGMHFPFGKEVEVKDKETAERLRHHSHFTEVGGKKAKDEPKEEAKPDLTGKSVAELREIAAGQGIDAGGMKKSEIKEALAG